MLQINVIDAQMSSYDLESCIKSLLDKLSFLDFACGCRIFCLCYIYQQYATPVK